MNSKAFFNRIYGENPTYYGLGIRKEFVDYLSSMASPGMKCLDVGAGQGRYAIYAAKMGLSVITIDHSEVAITQLQEYAKNKSLGLNAIVADITDRDLPKDEYDLIICVTLLDHLLDKPRRILANKIVASLKQGGSLYCEVFTTEDAGYSRLNNNVSETSEPVRHYFRKGELRDLFSPLCIQHYQEIVEEDNSHGNPHVHGIALLIGTKYEEG